jgi:integrase
VGWEECRCEELGRFFGAFEQEDAFTGSGVSYEAVRNAMPFFILAAETGIRRGDLMRLSWSSVHVEERVITLTMQKTGKEARIPITNACLLAIKELKARKVVSPSTVFLGVEGKPLPWVTIRRVFALVKKAAGIERKVRLHDFRHGVAHRLNAGGASAFTIMQTLGHTSLSTTARYTQADTATIAGDALEKTAWQR